MILKEILLLARIWAPSLNKNIPCFGVLSFRVLDYKDEFQLSNQLQIPQKKFGKLSS